MSEVISFRLDPNNAREALAIEILRAWQRRGYSLRQIMTEAVSKLDADGNDLSHEQLSGLYQKLDEISFQIQKIGNSSVHLSTEQDRESPDEGFSQRFIESIRVALKPGVGID